MFRHPHAAVIKGTLELVQPAWQWLRRTWLSHGLRMRRALALA